jgi:hypothetical protein
MDNVIILQDRNAERQAQPLPPGTTAEVIIFPGVRFERLTEDMMLATTIRRIPSHQNNATAEKLE